jgi:hypothetical protein
MKKYLSGILAIAFAIAGSAFTAPTPVNTTDDPVLHWFSPDLQTYLGQRTVSSEESLCPGAGNVCAKGYEEIDEEEETPITSTFVTNAQKSN